MNINNSSQRDGNLANDGNHGSTAEGIFDQALNKLRTALSDVDRSHIKEFRSHTDMIISVEKICSRYVGGRRMLFQCAERINTFANAFAPFFDVVNVYVQIKPEWAALVWGSLLLIFKLGVNLVSFFDRVTEMLQEMAMLLPQYETWYSICERTQAFTDKSRLSQSLAFVYGDFTDYIVHIYFLFTRSSKGRLRRTLLVGELMLRPFNSRFSQLKERIDKHRVWFETEAQIQQHDLVDKVYGSFQKFLESTSNKEDATKDVALQRAEDLRRFREIKSWIQSSDYDSLYDVISNAIHPGSGAGFVKIPEYVRLRDSAFTDRGDENPASSKDWLQRVVFLNGKPGLGKTYSSVRIIEDLRNSLSPSSDSENRPNVVFYHYSQTDRFKNNQPDGAFRAIAEQLIHANRNDQLTLDVLSMIQTEQGSGQRVASLRDIRAIVDVMLQRHPTFMIIDAVDECDKPEQLLEEVRRICIETDCRVLLLGRPSTPFPSQWKAYDSDAKWKVTLEPSIVFSDIAALIQSHLSEMVTMKLFYPNIETMDDLLRFTKADLIMTLTTASEGMLLWARLLINLLRSPAMSASVRIEVLRQPLALVSLDALYCQLLNTLEIADEHEQNIAQKVFQWLLFSARPLDVTTLHTALAVQLKRSSTGSDYLSKYPECIPLITCSLVELHRQRNSFVFLHKTFKSFLLGRNWCPPRLQLSQSVARAVDDPFHDKYQTLDVSYEAPERQFRIGDSERRLRLHDPETTYSAPRRSLIFDNLAPSSSHLYLAKTCLSYLVYNIPARPMTRTAGGTTNGLNCGFGVEAASESREPTMADASRIIDELSLQEKDVQYPLLMYSTMCWIHHFVRATSMSGSYGHGPPIPLDKVSVSLLAKFLLNRLTVTMWTELSYGYRLLPSTQGIMDLAAYLKKTNLHQNVEHWMYEEDEDRMHTREMIARERAWVGEGLRTLSEALGSLVNRHGAILLRNPTMIWKNEIRAAEDGHFWSSWPHEEEPTRMNFSYDGFSQHASWRINHDNPPTPSVG